MLQHIRLALRRLRHTPGYSLAFILTLGLGIGINTAIFSVVDGVLLQPLPYATADRLVYVKQPARLTGLDNLSFSFAEIADYRAATRTLDQIVEYGDLTFNVVGDGEPHIAIGGLVTSNYFETLGLRPQLGRTLASQDDGTSAAPVMVLTHDYWMRVYGGDTAVIERPVKVYVFSQPKTVRIVGVLRPGPLYTGTRRQDFFVNYATSDHYGGASMLNERTHRMTDVFARLAPGQTIQAAQSELESLNATIRQQHPDAYPAQLGATIAVSSWREELTREARPMLLILVGAVGLVLLLACANVANLTLTRLVRRERELAVRAALGAGVKRLRLELLTDNLLLGLAGAGLGLLLAWLSQSLLVQYAGRFTVRTTEIGLNGAVLAYTALIAMGVAVLLAWGPRLPGTGGLGSAALAASSARGSAGVPRKQLQRALVVSQLALCFALLVGAGLLIRTLFHLSSVNPGIRYENLVAMDVPSATGMSADQNRAVLDQVVERASQFPGMRAVAYSSRVPFSQTNLVRLNVHTESDPDTELNIEESAGTIVSPTYFRTIGVPILRGRDFEPGDNASGEPVAIINQAMAARMFSNGEAVGQRFAQRQFNGQWGPWLRIVGVAADTREHGIARAGTHTIYRPSAQAFPGQSLILRAEGDPAPAIKFVTSVVRELDSERPVDNVVTLESLRFEDLAPPRLNATLFAAFAVLALVIAAVGVFGVLAFSVSQRLREFGVRMALGAHPHQVLRLVLGEGGVLAVIALVVGGIGAVLLSHFLRGLLYQVTATDPLTFVGVGALLVSVALFAAYLPARRATRVDPADSLRAE
jgi:predicted permease